MVVPSKGEASGGRRLSTRRLKRSYRGAQYRMTTDKLHSTSWSALAAYTPHCKTTLLHLDTKLTRNSLTWGVLQERITTTSYGSASSPEKFKAPVVINTVQSTLACLLGYVYLLFTRRHSQDLPVFPGTRIVTPLLLVALTSSLASPFGYASLSHVDYITFILAKSCKLLPVMALHVTLFRRKYPLYKYAVSTLR